MKRDRSRIALLLLALMLVLGACGDGDAGDVDDRETESAPAQTSLPPGEDGASDWIVDGETIADADLFEAAQQDGELIMYTSMDEHLAVAIGEVFTDETGIEVEVVRAPSSPLYERILTELATGEFEGDLVDVSDASLAADLEERGVWRSHTVPSDELIPDGLKHPSSLTYNVGRYPILLIYNTAILSGEDVPTSWADLLDPRFGDRQIGTIRASTGGSSWAMALHQRLAVAEDYWERLAELDPVVYTGYAPLTEDVARGELTVGVSHFGQLRPHMAEGAPVDFVPASDGVPTVGYLQGVASEAAHPSAAELWLNWITSVHGGTIMQDISFYYAAHQDVPPPIDPDAGITEPLVEEQLWIPPSEEYITLRDEWTVEWDALFD